MSAALASTAPLLRVAIWVTYEAIRRCTEPPEVLAGTMLWVAVAGLAANVVAFARPRPGSKEPISPRGASLEMLGDMLGSVGAHAAAVVIATTGWQYADPIIAGAVALFIVPRTLSPARSAVRLLVQAAPENIDVGAVASTLRGVDGVRRCMICTCGR